MLSPPHMFRRRHDADALRCRHADTPNITHMLHADAAYCSTPYCPLILRYACFRFCCRCRRCATPADTLFRYFRADAVMPPLLSCHDACHGLMLLNTPLISLYFAADVLLLLTLLISRFAAFHFTRLPPPLFADFRSCHCFAADLRCRHGHDASAITRRFFFFAIFFFAADVLPPLPFLPPDAIFHYAMALFPATAIYMPAASAIRESLRVTMLPRRCLP